MSKYDVKICRTCLDFGNANMKSLHDSGWNTVPLIEMLRVCTVVEYLENDGLPTDICKQCIMELNQAYIFAKKCEVSESISRERSDNPYYNPISNKPVKKAFHEPVIKPHFVAINDHLNNSEIYEKIELSEENPLNDSEINEKSETALSLNTKQNVNYTESAFIKSEHTKEEINDKTCKKVRNKAKIRKGTAKNEVSKTRNNTSKNIRNNPIEIISSDSDNDEKNYNCSILDAKDEGRLYVCLFCNKSFPQLDTFKTHCLVHKEDNLLNCVICDKDFASIGKLIFHNKSVHGKKVYSCEICKKDYSRESLLTKHKKLHEKYSCHICHKYFKNARNWKVHIRIHNNDKPYSCEICLKTFRDQNGLITHKRITHTREGPYQCRFCGIRFKQKSTKTRHEQMHIHK